MEEEIEKSALTEAPEREEIFSKAVRAGKRTYFFDVKATKKNDYYLTITESKKRFNREGNVFYEKHKIFLYKEDFEKFFDNLNEVIQFIQAAKPVPYTDQGEENEEQHNAEFATVEFEDLEKQ